MGDENTTVSMVSSNARMKEVAGAAAIPFVAINGWNCLNSAFETVPGIYHAKSI